MKRHVIFESSKSDFDYIWQYFGLSQSRDFRQSESAEPRLSTFDGMSIRLLGKDSDEQGVTIQIDDVNVWSDIILKNYLQDRLREYLETLPIKKFPVDKHCFYCGKRLKYRKVGEHIDIRSYVNSEDFDPLDMSLYTLEWCINCNYWNWIHFEETWLGRAQLTGYLYTNMVSKLREFDMELPQGSIEEIGAWIRRNSSAWHSINPTRFEQLVADIFRANYQHADVSHVGRSDDGGVDVIYIDADDKQWLVQVKRRENPKSTESVSTIRNLLGAMLLQDSRAGIVVSTADHFSYQAHAAVDQAHKVGMTLRLIDRYALDHMLDGVLQDQPWSAALGQYYPTQLRVLNQRMPDREKRQTSDIYQLRLFKDL